MSKNFKRSTYVTYTNKEFYKSKKDKNTTICKLTFSINTEKFYPAYCKPDKMRSFIKFLKSFNEYTGMNDFIDCNVNFTVLCKTTCKPSDTYDEKLGEHIALTKCQNKAFKIAREVFVFGQQMMYTEFMNPIEGVLAHQTFCINKSENHIVELSNK